MSNYNISLCLNEYSVVTKATCIISKHCDLKWNILLVPLRDKTEQYSLPQINVINKENTFCLHTCCTLAELVPIKAFSYCSPRLLYIYIYSLTVRPLCVVHSPLLSLSGYLTFLSGVKQTVQELWNYPDLQGLCYTLKNFCWRAP